MRESENMPLSSLNIEKFAQELFEKIENYAPDINLKKIQSAYDFAKQAHQGQLRKSGEPYIIHPLRTAKILTNLRVDEETLIAALLHDVSEDTPISLTEIEERFGKIIAYLVDGITKLTKVHYRESMEQRQIESLKKMFIHSAKDLRVILIKLADRLDNMRTLQFIADEKKRTRIARETLEIYVPIANLLGIGGIRAELENFCFEYLFPLDFTNLKRELEETTEQRSFILKEMIHVTEKEFHKQHMEAEITGRPKTLYSIYRKLHTQQTLSNIDDLIAVRIMVPTRRDCYDALGIIHRLFKPKTGCVKDYIAVPKSNGYQSIHTTVFGLSSSVVEFQIRTRYMHLEAEYGVAAHYFYKYSDEQELASLMRQRSNWVQRILDIQKDQKDSEHFLENLKLDIFQDRIFVFTPKGDVIDLPCGASAIDFAYTIHTDIGAHAMKAEINGIPAALTKPLGTGDTVNIITKKEATPQREWLNFVKTSLAATKIKEYLCREPMEKKLAVGKKILQKEFDRMGKNFLEELNSKNLQCIVRKTSYKSLPEIFVAIGEGHINPHQLFEEFLAGEKSIRRNTKAQSSNAFSKVDLHILGENNNNQFYEIIRTLNALRIPVLKFIIDRPFYLEYDRCRVKLLIRNYNELNQVFESLEQLSGILKVTRRFVGRKIWFLICSAVTAMLWLSHPVLMYSMLVQFPEKPQLSNFMVYGGLILLLGLLLYLKKIAGRSLPEVAETLYYWPLLYVLTTLTLFTIIGEVMLFHLTLNWMIVLTLIGGMYGLLTTSYLRTYPETWNRK